MDRVDGFIKDPKKALFRLSAPVIIAMLVQTLYNIVDTAFVGRLGSDAIAALTFSFPIFFILIALNHVITIGMTSRISRYMGEKKKKAAENTAIHGLILTVISSLIISVLGTIFIKEIFILFGASSVLGMAIEYMNIILFGIIFMFPAFLLNSIFSAQGDTKTPMKIQVTALVINIILDPIFIYTFGLGIKGAALATVTAFAISLLLGIYYIKRHSVLKIRKESFSFKSYIVRDILKVGLPSSLTMTLMSFFVIVINRLMSGFGTDYVAAFGIAARLKSLATMPVIAFAIALMTLSGMFYGAKRYDLLRNIIFYAIKIGTAFTMIIGAILFIFPDTLLKIFTDNPELIRLSTAYLRLDVFTFPFIAIGILTARAMQGTGTGLPGLLLNLTRVVFIGIPLSYIFVKILNYNYLSVAVATIIGAVIGSAIAFIWMFKRLERCKDRC